MDTPGASEEAQQLAPSLGEVVGGGREPQGLRAPFARSSPATIANDHRRTRPNRETQTVSSAEPRRAMTRRLAAP